jgi:hypothetical protein
MKINNLILALVGATVAVVLFISFSYFNCTKERFSSGAPLTTNDQLDTGIITREASNPLPLYFKDKSLEEMNVYLERIVSNDLKKQLSSTSTSKDEGRWVISLSTHDKHKLNDICSKHFIQSLNSLSALTKNNYKLLNSQIEQVEALDENHGSCNLIMNIHRESKQYGYVIQAKLVIRDEKVIGVADAKAIGIVSEDKLLLNQGYDGQPVHDNAFNIDHKIIRDHTYEQDMLRQHADGLLKDRGIKAPSGV